MSMMAAYARMSPETMRVQLIEVPVPDVADDEALVSIEAFGVGIHDRYFMPQDARFPYVIGTEGAGRILRIGAQISDYRVGDRVVFTSVLNPKGGTWADCAAVKGAALVPVPDDLPIEAAATVPIAGKTALQCMADLGLARGSTLFIAGASGAIGTFAIQLAVRQGIRVAGSASPQNHDYLRSLGAEMAVDYKSADWQQAVRDWGGGGVVATLAIQPGTGISAIKAVRDGGRVLTVSGDADKVPPERGIMVAQMSYLGDMRQGTQSLLAAIAEGTVRTVIAAQYPFEEALDALEKTETRHARGKLAVRGRTGRTAAG
jgi:NADPH:quinone reductase-like Zn-dependent oxidoreductase